MKKSNMYENTRTYNPFVGCGFGCVYCKPSFQRQLKRVAGRLGCSACARYWPHKHFERMGKIPSAPTVFVVGTGDIRFSPTSYVWAIFGSIDNHKPRMKKQYYFQSKNPLCFKQYMKWFKLNQEKVMLLTTLETNRDEGYDKISRAPPPTQRFKDFYDLDYGRKVVTIEPVLDFDLAPFVDMILQLHAQGSLEYVWFGFDSKNCGLPEPSEEKAQVFVDCLQDNGIEVRGKTLRGVKIRVKLCPDCGNELVSGRVRKQPNQYSASRWKRVYVCTNCGEVK